MEARSGLKVSPYFKGKKREKKNNVDDVTVPSRCLPNQDCMKAHHGPYRPINQKIYLLANFFFFGVSLM